MNAIVILISRAPVVQPYATDAHAIRVAELVTEIHEAFCLPSRVISVIGTDGEYRTIFPRDRFLAELAIGDGMAQSRRDVP